MDPIPPDAVINIGQSILVAKRYIMAFSFLWIWDYALTFEDEVNYAWKGKKKSWVFVLYLLNRYCALPYVVWILFIVALWWSGDSQMACDRTIFLETLYFNFATLFAQTILTLRVHAVTRENKLFTTVLVCVTLAQFFFGCYVWVQVFRLGASVWPPEDPSSLRICCSNAPEVHQIIIVSLSLVYDLLAFLIIVWIVGDATVYFLVIFTSHLLVEFFMLFAPKPYRFLPAGSNVIFISIMASRLLLSLRRAADETVSLEGPEDLDAMGHIVFAGEHMTVDRAVEVGASDI